jgi:hypothetical protein
MDHAAAVTDYDTAAQNLHAQLVAKETAARVAEFEAGEDAVYANDKVYGQAEPEEDEYANDSVCSWDHNAADGCGQSPYNVKPDRSAELEGLRQPASPQVGGAVVVEARIGQEEAQEQNEDEEEEEQEVDHEEEEVDEEEEEEEVVQEEEEEENHPHDCWLFTMCKQENTTSPWCGNADKTTVPCANRNQCGKYMHHDCSMQWAVFHHTADAALLDHLDKCADNRMCNTCCDAWLQCHTDKVAANRKAALVEEEDTLLEGQEDKEDKGINQDNPLAPVVPQRVASWLDPRHSAQISDSRQPAAQEVEEGELQEAEEVEQVSTRGRSSSRQENKGCTTKRGRESAKQQRAYEQYKKALNPVQVHDHSHTLCHCVIRLGGPGLFADPRGIRPTAASDQESGGWRAAAPLSWW